MTKKVKEPTIRFGNGYVVKYLHGQYLWYGTEKGPAHLNASARGQSPIRFAKAILKEAERRRKIKP